MSKPNDIVKHIRKAIRRKFSADENIRIVLEKLRGKISIPELSRKEGSDYFLDHQSLNNRSSRLQNYL